MASITKLLLPCFLGLLMACSGNGNATEQELATTPHIPQALDRQTQLQFRQYFGQGRVLYKKHCIGCHQNDGNGMAQLIPPLAGADFLQNTAQVMCVIRHGMQGPVVVNGVEYVGNMPANPQLRPLEIAEIATYIQNAWGNKGNFVRVHEAEAALKDCAKPPSRESSL